MRGRVAGFESMASELLDGQSSRVPAGTVAGDEEDEGTIT